MATAILSTIFSILIATYPVTAKTPLKGEIKAENGTTMAKEEASPITFTVRVTAYSSSPDETKEDNQTTTASNVEVHDGVLAANFLPFHTKVKIPALFGDKVFTVLDRMNRRKKDFVDIWMPSKQEALNFGIHKTDIVIVD
ncbi:MAG: 3D domain-containing protein [Patescibacteria group bacterium]